MSKYNQALTKHVVEPAVEFVLDELGNMGVEAHANVYPNTGTVQLTLKGERPDISMALHCWLDGMAQRNLGNAEKP